MNKNIYQLSPDSSLELLSIKEMKWLMEHSKQSELHELLRCCVLAVLNSGSAEDNVRKILDQYHDFDFQLKWRQRGVFFELTQPPLRAFVDGELIKGIKEQISSVVRDLVYSQMMLEEDRQCNLNICKEKNNPGEGVTDFVFKILRNSKSIVVDKKPSLVVCWGGHSISGNEYKYTKKVGYQLGLRGLDICTGCGAGAMKGPMKGATIAHAKQRQQKPLYLGITEPGIISSESPNPIVNHLVIMPDIEKRLEAFIRLAHSVVIFPGGVGTAEELLYLLGVMSHPDNKNNPLKIILTGPLSSRDYFKILIEFIEKTLGKSATKLIKLIINDSEKVAKTVLSGVEETTQYRKRLDDSFHFNWRLKVEKEWQTPFSPTHKNMEKLNLSKQQPIHTLALELRKAFSGIVTGNVKPEGIKQIEQHGPFVMKNGGENLRHLDELLKHFVEQKRMMISSDQYHPCYRIQPD